MRKIVVKAPAKINLTLDVLGTEGKFHEIKTLVSTINVYDKITVKTRKDSRISLDMKGIAVDCDMAENNAYKAAKLYMDNVSTMGADITIEKHIPIGAGLGGSSADIAGVLIGMQKAYKQNADLLSLANSLGSDSGYLLSGGYAVLTGRGEKIVQKNISQKLHLLIITDSKSVSSRASYKAFDRLEKTFKPCTAQAEKALKEGNFEKFCSVIKNDLYWGSCTLNENISVNLVNLKRVGAPAQLMTGSGSAVVGIFKDKKQRDKAYKKLLPLYKNDLIKAQTE